MLVFRFKRGHLILVENLDFNLNDYLPRELSRYHLFFSLFCMEMACKIIHRR